MYINFSGLLLFMAILKLLKILEFNNKISLLIFTLNRCWGELSGFLGMYFLQYIVEVEKDFMILKPPITHSLVLQPTLGRQTVDMTNHRQTNTRHNKPLTNKH